MIRMETHAKFPYLIKVEYIKNDNTSEFFYYANSDTDIEFRGNTYLASVFSIQPPEKKADSISNAKLIISAIDQTWIQRIRESDKRSKVTFIATIEYEDNGSLAVESIEEEEFELSVSQWNETEISFNMEFDPLADIQCPIDEINIFNTPALG